MQQFIEYLSHHPYYAGGALLAALAVAIYELRTGVDTFGALSALQAVRLINQGALLIDLREAAQYAAGHIGEARHIPLARIAEQGEALKKWRDKNVITYCDTGRDGAAAARTLKKLGFTQVYSLEGGLNGWVKDNMPVVKATAASK